jgi:hypothetical protein
VTTEEDVKRVFSALDQNDACALCFTWMLGDQEDLTPLRRSAELGFAFAQAFMADRTRGDEKFQFAQLAAAQGECDGFAFLGWCFGNGVGCEKNLDKAKENFLLAMFWLGDLLDELDPQRWRWRGRAAALGDSWSFLSNFVWQVELFSSGFRSAAVMFTIGQALQGHVNEETRTIFEDENDSLENKQSHSTMRKSKQPKMRCTHGLLLASS